MFDDSDDWLALHLLGVDLDDVVAAVEDENDRPLFAAPKDGSFAAAPVGGLFGLTPVNAEDAEILPIGGAREK
jgi:hypothetical protein